ncbi:aminotransferase-like domain-containing protein [Sinorhizobium medicae]
METNLDQGDCGPLVEQPISLIRSTPPTPQWLGEALIEVLRDIENSGNIATLLRYHTFSGSEADRSTASLWLEERFGQRVDPGRIIVTNGTQSALFLTLRTVVGAGNHILTEDLSYYGFRRLAALLGITATGVAMDANGAIPEAFDKACRQHPPRAIFLQPTLHNPTAIIMSTERRKALAEVARRHGVAIIEDDVYGSLPSLAPPPVAAIAPELTWFATGPAKCMGPGLRIGYLVAPSEEEAKHATSAFDTISTWHTNPLSAAIMERWVANGTLMRVRNAVRAEIAERQKIARKQLAGLDFSTHPESVYLWLALPTGLDQEALLSSLLKKGVVLRSGEMFLVDPKRRAGRVRVVVGSPETRTELQTALSIIRSELSPA